MSEPSFTLTTQQIDNLNRWVGFLQTEESKKWDTDEREASKEFNRILSEAISDGNDLNTNQLDNLFANMRRMINNRALTRLLYTANDIQIFNRALRQLLLGTDSLTSEV